MINCRLPRPLRGSRNDRYLRDYVILAPISPQAWLKDKNLFVYALDVSNNHLYLEAFA